MNFTNIRRTEYPAGYKDNEIMVDEVGVNSISNNLKSLIKNIFISYKQNGFENNKHLNLFRTYLLLQNLQRTNGEFIQMVLNKRNQVVETINYILPHIIDDTAVDLKYDIKDDIDKFNSDFINMFFDIIEKYNVSFNDDKKSNDGYTTQEVDDYINQKISRIINLYQEKDDNSKQKLECTTNNINQISHIFSGVINSFNKKLTSLTLITLSNESRITTKYLQVQTHPANPQIKMARMVVKHINDMIINTVFNVQRISNTIIKKSQKDKKKNRNRLIGFIHKQINRVKNRILSFDLKNFVTGVIKTPFRIIGGLFNSVKNSVVNTTKNILKKMKNPVLDILKGMITTVPGAFILGWITGKIFSAVKDFTVDISDIIKGSKELFHNVVKKFRKSIEKIENFILQVRQHKELMNGIVGIVHKILDSFTPSGMLKSIGLTSISAGVTGLAMGALKAAIGMASTGVGLYVAVAAVAAGAILWSIGKFMEVAKQKQKDANKHYSGSDKLEEVEAELKKMSRQSMGNFKLQQSTIGASKYAARLFDPKKSPFIPKDSNVVSSDIRSMQAFLDDLSNNGNIDGSKSKTKWIEYIDKLRDDIYAEAEFLATMVDKDNILTAIKNGSIFKPILQMYIGGVKVKTLKYRTNQDPITLRLINLRYHLELLKQLSSSNTDNPEQIFDNQIKNLFKDDGGNSLSLDENTLHYLSDEKAYGSIDLQMTKIKTIDINNNESAADTISESSGYYTWNWVTGGYKFVSGNLHNIGQTVAQSFIDTYNQNLDEQFREYKATDVNKYTYSIIMMHMIAQKDYYETRRYSFHQVFNDILIEKLKSDSTFFGNDVISTLRKPEYTSLCRSYFYTVISNSNMVDVIIEALKEKDDECFWFETLKQQKFIIAPLNTFNTLEKRRKENNAQNISSSIVQCMRSGWVNRFSTERIKFYGVPVILEILNKYDAKYNQNKTSERIKEMKENLKNALKGVLEVFEKLITNKEEADKFMKAFSSQMPQNKIQQTMYESQESNIKMTEDMTQNELEQAEDIPTQTQNLRQQLEELKRGIEKEQRSRNKKVEDSGVQLQQTYDVVHSRVDGVSNQIQNQNVALVGEREYGSSVKMGRQYVYSL